MSWNYGIIIVQMSTINLVGEYLEFLAYDRK